MQKYSLELDDFPDNKYTLIGVHSTLEEYKFAYLLNQKLEIRLVRASYNLDFENKKNNAAFSIYEYISTKFSHSWYLISNQFTNKFNGVSTGLFDTSEITTCLISEKKKVDFFLKLEGYFDEALIENIVDEINSIDQVIASYIIDPKGLKSKEFLIF